MQKLRNFITKYKTPLVMSLFIVYTTIVLGLLIAITVHSSIEARALSPPHDTPLPNSPIQSVATTTVNGFDKDKPLTKNKTPNTLMDMSPSYTKRTYEGRDNSVSYVSNLITKKELKLKPNTQYSIICDSAVVVHSTGGGGTSLFTFYYSDGSNSSVWNNPNEIYTKRTFNSVIGKTVVAVGTSMHEYRTTIYIDLDTLMMIETNTEDTTYEPFMSYNSIYNGALADVEIPGQNIYNDINHKEKLVENTLLLAAIPILPGIDYTFKVNDIFKDLNVYRHLVFGFSTHINTQCSYEWSNDFGENTTIKINSGDITTQGYAILYINPYYVESDMAINPTQLMNSYSYIPDQIVLQSSSKAVSDIIYESYDNGYTNGHTDGYKDGLNSYSAIDNAIPNMVGSIGDFFKKIFSFEIMGISLGSIFGVFAVVSSIMLILKFAKA